MGFRQMFIAADQLANALIGGYADETISARAHRLHKTSSAWRVVRGIANGLFFWQEDHCQKAWQNEYERRGLPVEYRK